MWVSNSPFLLLSVVSLERDQTLYQEFNFASLFQITWNTSSICRDVIGMLSMVATEVKHSLKYLFPILIYQLYWESRVDQCGVSGSLVSTSWRVLPSQHSLWQSSDRTCLRAYDCSRIWSLICQILADSVQFSLPNWGKRWIRSNSDSSRVWHLRTSKKRLYSLKVSNTEAVLFKVLLGIRPGKVVQTQMEEALMGDLWETLGAWSSSSSLQSTYNCLSDLFLREIQSQIVFCFFSNSWVSNSMFLQSSSYILIYFSIFLKRLEQTTLSLLDPLICSFSTLILATYSLCFCRICSVSYSCFFRVFYFWLATLLDSYSSSLLNFLSSLPKMPTSSFRTQFLLNSESSLMVTLRRMSSNSVSSFQLDITNLVLPAPCSTSLSMRFLESLFSLTSLSRVFFCLWMIEPLSSSPKSILRSLCCISNFYYINNMISLYYILNLIILVAWVPFLFSTINDHSSAAKTYNVVIVGCNIQAAIVAFYIKAVPSLNVTIVSEGECSFESQRHFAKSNAIVGLFQQLNFKYKIVGNSMGFWDGKVMLTTDTSTEKQIRTFGLSSFALKTSLKKFDNWLRKCQKKPFTTIYECLKRLHIQTTMTSSKYLLDQVGLDREYVRLVLLPYLRGCEHDINSNFLNLKLKLIEMFHPLVQFKGSQKDLGFRLLEGVRLLDQQSSVSVSPRNASSYEVRTPEHNLSAAFVILCNTSDSKEFFFKTIIKGKIDPAHYNLQQPELPTIIYSNDNVVRIRKQCTVSCTKAENNLYVVTSTGRVFEKDLRMFSQYQLISWQRYKVNKLASGLRELPQITDGKGIYLMNEVSSITDSKQFMILYAKNIAGLIHGEVTR